MEIKLLKGGTTKINLKKYLLKKETYQRSKFQSRIIKELKGDYPLDNIYEEVYIPVEKFYLDIFIPSRSLVVEVQGRQHKLHIHFFHKTKVDFNNQKNRDLRKMEWCILNGFKLVEIYDK